MNRLDRMRVSKKPIIALVNKNLKAEFNENVNASVGLTRNRDGQPDFAITVQGASSKDKAKIKKMVTRDAQSIMPGSKPVVTLSGKQKAL